MKLHPIDHDIKTTLWCGPAALATISGQPVSACMAAIRACWWDKSKPIKGISNTTLVKAAAVLGFRLTEIKMPFHHQVTLACWTREHGPMFADAPVVVNVTGHYVTVKGQSFNDNSTRKPVSLKRAPHRRARVQRAFTVEPMVPTAPPVMVAPVVTVRPNPPRDLNKLKAQRMASANAIPCAKDNEASDVIWVYAPPALDTEELDRYASEGHACYDWAEALDRVTNYVHDLNRAQCAKIATL